MLATTGTNGGRDSSNCQGSQPLLPHDTVSFWGHVLGHGVPGWLDKEERLHPVLVGYSWGFVQHVHNRTVSLTGKKWLSRHLDHTESVLNFPGTGIHVHLHSPACSAGAWDEQHSPPHLTWPPQDQAQLILSVHSWSMHHFLTFLQPLIDTWVHRI